MEQANNLICKTCMSPVPSGQKFCGRCGGPSSSAASVARLASTFGEELGFEAIRELHVSGTHQRVSWLADGDGSASCVLASADSDVMAMAKKIRR